MVLINKYKGALDGVDAVVDINAANELNLRQRDISGEVNFPKSLFGLTIKFGYFARKFERGFIRRAMRRSRTNRTREGTYASNDHRGVGCCDCNR